MRVNHYKMSNKFLGGSSADLTNGTANLYIANLTIDNLNASQPLKTNTVKTLESTKLDISDVLNLQTQLDSKLSNPLIQDINFQGFAGVNVNNIEFNKTAGQLNAGAGKLRIYANNDGTIHKVDENGTDTPVGGGNPFNQDLNTTDNVVFNQMTVSSTFGTYRVSSNEQEWRCFGTIDPRWEIRRARGSSGAPQDIQAGDKIKDELAFSYGGGSSEIVYESLVSATENHTSTAKGTKLEISTCNNGTDIPTDKIILDSQGVNIREGLRLGDFGTDITFPITRGTNGQILKSDANGVLTFQDESGGYDQSLNKADEVEFKKLTIDGNLNADIVLQNNNVDVATIRANGGELRFLNNANDLKWKMTSQGNVVNSGSLTVDGSNFSVNGSNNAGAFIKRGAPTSYVGIDLLDNTSTHPNLRIQQKANEGNLTITNTTSLEDVAVFDVVDKSLIIDKVSASSIEINASTGNTFIHKRPDNTIPTVLAIEKNNIFQWGIGCFGGVIADDYSFYKFGGINSGVAMRILDADGKIAIGGVANGYILPRVRGTNNQILKTDGVGNVSWQDDAEGNNNLSGLDDVLLSGLAPDDLLQYNLGGNFWFNRPANTLFGNGIEGQALRSDGIGAVFSGSIERFIKFDNSLVNPTLYEDDEIKITWEGVNKQCQYQIKTLPANNNIAVAMRQINGGTSRQDSDIISNNTAIYYFYGATRRAAWDLDDPGDEMTATITAEDDINFPVWEVKCIVGNEFTNGFFKVKKYTF